MIRDDYFTFDVGLNVVGPVGQEEYVLTLFNKDGKPRIMAGNRVEHRVSMNYDQREIEVGEIPGDTDRLADCITAIFGFNSFRTMIWQKRVGLELFNTFFPPKESNVTLGREFRNALKPNKRIRLRLWYPPEANQIDKLLRIPWEYLYYSSNSNINNGFFLCRSSNLSIVHYCRSDKPIVRQNKNALPVRTVFLSTEDVPDATFRQVADSSALTNKRKRILQIEKWAREMQLNDLRSAFEEYGIVQCLLHGGPKELFVRKLDGTEGISSNEIQEMSADIQNGLVQIVLLCACEDAGVPSAPANQLHKMGVPVVIGFTKIMLKEQATRFMEDFTSRLADNVCSLDEALVFARNGLLSQSETSVSPKLSLDWGAARMFLATTDSDVVTKDTLFFPVYKNILNRFQEEVKKLLAKLSDDPQFPYEQRILEWFGGSQRILYLPGISGSGKSTQIAHLIDSYEPKDQLLYHLCAVRGEQSTDENVNHPLVFVRDSLYPQLERCFGVELYRSWVEPHYPYVIDKAEDAIEQLVIEPLRKARNSGQWKQPVLIIDGLDHAQVFEPGYTLLDLLTDYIQPLTEGLRLLITAASDHGEADQRISNLLGARDNSKTVIPLQVNAETMLDELRQHITKILGEGAQFLETLMKVDNSQINYQFVDFIKRIADQTLLTELLRIRTKSNFLETAYELTWLSMQNQYPDKIDVLEKLLKVLGVAYVPLSQAMLTELVKTDQIGDLLKIISPFIQKDEQGRVSCEHPSIKYFLETLPSKYDGHGLFMEMYRQQSSDQTWGNMDWSNLKYSDYAGHYLSEHAYWYYVEGGKYDARQGLDDYLRLMTSPGFRKFRREKTRYTDAAAAIEDIRRALRVFYVKVSIENARIAGDFQSVEEAWNAANHAMSKVNRVQATYGRSDNSLLLDLEEKLCREGNGLFKPLLDFWSLYFPSLFSKHPANPPLAENRPSYRSSVKKS